MPKRAQGAIEYILLAGAVILFVVVVITIIRTYVLAPGANETQSHSSEYFGFLENFSNATVTP